MRQTPVMAAQSPLGPSSRSEKLQTFLDLGSSSQHSGFCGHDEDFTLKELRLLVIEVSASDATAVSPQTIGTPPMKIFRLIQQPWRQKDR
jgi:hypothetical protein